jgi:hypothetical protein
MGARSSSGSYGDRARVVLGNSSFIAYPEAGGHWNGFLQFLAGLAALGHDVLWLELFTSTGDDARDRELLELFFNRMASHGVGDRCAVLVYDRETDGQRYEQAQVHGREPGELRRYLQSADILWNIACAIRQPLLSLFRRRALIDGDPGHLQVAALEWDMGISDHEALLTVGGKLHDPDCAVPTLGRSWAHYLPPLHLPMWGPPSDPPPRAPVTSITHWNWGELWHEGEVLSIAKRDAYLPYADVPRLAPARFELASDLQRGEPMGDAKRLEDGGWHLVQSHDVAGDPESYRGYIRRSRAELCCAKPIFRELRTGWFSDRSAGYLASGRPVIAEDTGFPDVLPEGEGLVAFGDAAGAAAAVGRVVDDYAAHAEAARQLAGDFFDARKVLPQMLEASL